MNANGASEYWSEGEMEPPTKARLAFHPSRTPVLQHAIPS